MLARSQGMQVIFKQANFAGIKLVQVSSRKELADWKKKKKGVLRLKHLKIFSHYLYNLQKNFCC